MCKVCGCSFKNGETSLCTAVVDESRWSPDFFQASSSNCLNWKIYCYDHSSLSSLRCEQNHEYQESVLADCAKTAVAEKLDLEEEELQGEDFASPLSLDDMRELRVAHF